MGDFTAYPDGTITQNGVGLLREDQKALMFDLFPNLRAVKEIKNPQLFREYKPMLDLIEFTIIFKDENDERWRIDALWEPRDEVQITPITADELKVTYWGPARRQP